MYVRVLVYMGGGGCQTHPTGHTQRSLPRSSLCGPQPVLAATRSSPPPGAAFPMNQGAPVQGIDYCELKKQFLVAARVECTEHGTGARLWGRIAESV